MQEYVLGFPILKNKSALEKTGINSLSLKKDRTIVLIRKYKPELRAEFFNAIGGKIIKEDGEGQNSDYIHQSMFRHFKDATGIETSSKHWNQYATFSDGRSYIVYCFRTFLFTQKDFWGENQDKPVNPKLEAFSLLHLPYNVGNTNFKILDDIPYLAFLASDEDVEFVSIERNI